MNNLENKKVSIPLAIGIFLIPLIFAWFTLKKGYSTQARVLSFGWLALGFIAFALVPAPPEQTNSTQQAEVVEKTEAEKTALADAEAAIIRQQFEDRKAELAEEDKPHFEWPKVDYTKAVAKVTSTDDQSILKAVAKPIIEKEDIMNENGEPATIYYFSKNLVNGLDITLSREFVDVTWRFDEKDPVKATDAFNDGQQITRALLGGKEGSNIYEAIAKGQKFDTLHLEDGTEIKNARCGSNVCRYQIVR